MKLEKWVSSLQITSVKLHLQWQVMNETRKVSFFIADNFQMNQLCLTSLGDHWLDSDLTNWQDSDLTNWQDSDLTNLTRQWPVTGQTWQDSDQCLVKPDKTVTSVWSNLTRQRPVTSQTSWQWPLTKHHKLWPVKPNSDHWPVKLHMPCWPLTKHHKLWPVKPDSDHWPVKLHMPCWPLTKHHKPWLNLVTFTTDQSNLTWLWQLTSQTSWKWPMTSQTSQDSDQWSVNPNDSDCWPVKAHDSNHSPSNGMTVTTDQPVTTDQ